MGPGFTRRRAAVAAMFFVNGMLFATWVSRIPGIKDGLGLSEARLGVALLALALGTFSSLPLTSRLIARHGSRAVVEGSAMACCLVLPMAAWSPTFASLCGVLVVLGMALGSMDVAMNAQASMLEGTARRSIMSSFHGLWSLGGLAGAGLAGVVAGRGLSPLVHFLAVGLALAVLAAGTAHELVPDRRSAAAPALAWPSHAALTVGFVGACGAVVEGGIADWSGVYLRDVLRTGAGAAASGFAAFSLAMTVGRFTGDRLVDRFGRRAMLRSGPALTGAALAVALLAPSPGLAVAAFGLAGLGMCTVFPIAFSTAGRLPGPGPGHTIAAVATMAYGGGLVGPPLIGFVAEAATLPVALGLLVLACAAIATMAGRLPVPAAVADAEAVALGPAGRER